MFLFITSCVFIQKKKKKPKFHLYSWYAKSKRMTAFEELPEGCIAAILSSTTPLDAGRLSLVSKNFLSAADSDAVWNRFLPSDISSIISHFPSLANIPAKKDLYLALSDRPIIIDNGKKVFFFPTTDFSNIIELVSFGVSNV